MHILVWKASKTNCVIVNRHKKNKYIKTKLLRCLKFTIKKTLRASLFSNFKSSLYEEVFISLERFLPL